MTRQMMSSSPSQNGQGERQQAELPCIEILANAFAA